MKLKCVVAVFCGIVIKLVASIKTNKQLNKNDT